MAFVARQFIYPFSSGPSVGINSVMANSRPSIRYELIHSLNRPRFTVCPGQTWNVAPTRNEKFMSFQRPDWHRGKRANPVSGLLQSYNSMSRDLMWAKMYETSISVYMPIVPGQISTAHLWAVSRKYTRMVPTAGMYLTLDGGATNPEGLFL